MQKGILETNATLESLKKRLDEKGDGLTKEQVDKVVNELVEKVAKEQEERHEKQVADYQTQLDEQKKEIEGFKAPEGKESLFGSKEGQISMQAFMRGVVSGDQELKKKTNMTEGTAAQGGYTVPEEFAGRIVEIAANASVVDQLTLTVPMKTNKFDIPKQLTAVSVAWTDEESTKSKTKPTFTEEQLVLKKLCAIVVASDELLDDTQVDLTGFIQRRIGLRMGLEIDRVILEGSTIGGDIINGIINATAPTAVAMGAATLSYNDLVDLMNAQTVELFHDGAAFWMNRAALSLVMKLKDTTNRDSNE